MGGIGAAEQQQGRQRHRQAAQDVDGHVNEIGANTSQMQRFLIAAERENVIAEAGAIENKPEHTAEQRRRDHRRWQAEHCRAIESFDGGREAADRIAMADGSANPSLIPKVPKVTTKAGSDR